MSDYSYAERAERVLFDGIVTSDDVHEVVSEFSLSFKDKLTMYVGQRELGVETPEYKTVVQNEYEPELTLFKVAAILCEDSPSSDEILSRFGMLLDIICTRIDFEMIVCPEDEE